MIGDSRFHVLGMCMIVYEFLGRFHHSPSIYVNDSLVVFDVFVACVGFYILSFSRSKDDEPW